MVGGRERAVRQRCVASFGFGDGQRFVAAKSAAWGLGFASVLGRGRFQRLLNRSPIPFTSPHGSLSVRCQGPGEQGLRDARVFCGANQPALGMASVSSPRNRPRGFWVSRRRWVVADFKGSSIARRSPSPRQPVRCRQSPCSSEKYPRGRMPRMSASGRMPAKEKRTGGSCFP